MVKEFVRTITAYRHTLGVVEKDEGGGLKVNVAAVVDLTYPMGDRKARQYVKENGLPDGTHVITIDKVSQKYAMPLDVFMQHAVKVEE